MSNSTIPNCECGVTQSEPTLENPPNLPAISYRFATYSTFLSRMIAQLPLQTVPPGDPAATLRPLPALTNRGNGDPTVALLDAWAMVLDVFTFYQERIANEGYLGTATERLSVRELARASGYELHPGLAATTYLAFTADGSAGAPPVAAVPRGTKVQSLPGPGEQPQVFETQTDFAARAVFNQLSPRQSQPQDLKLVAADDDTTPVLMGPDPDPAQVGQYVARNYLYLAGTNLNIKVGDMLLIVDRSSNPIRTLPLPVSSVTVDTAGQRTRVDLAPPTGDPIPLFLTPALPAGVINTLATPLTKDYVRENIVGASWHESDLRAQIAFQRWSQDDLLSFAAQVVAERPDSVEVYALRQRVGFFGNSAPLYKSLTRPGPSYYPNYGSPGTDYDWDDGNARPIWQRSTSGSASPYNTYSADLGPDAFLDRSVSGIAAGSFVVFLNSNSSKAITYTVLGTAEFSLAEFATNGKATGLLLALAKKPTTRIGDADKEPSFFFRSTVAYVQSERLPLAALPIESPVAASDGGITLDGMVLNLNPGQPVWVRGQQADAPSITQDEVVLLGDIVHAGGYTSVSFSTSLSHSYLRSSLTINANLVSASHGETVPTEVLGSGDAAKENQSFLLKKPNVTFLSSQSASGTQSTIVVTVNGIAWPEVPSLYNLDGRSENFTLQNEEDGTTRIFFGDGVHGARLPTGIENVVANYRTCDAAAGGVAAGQLSLLKTRPLGIRAVTNPLAATGNSPPESLAQGRANAPLETELIDRIITLKDYESFAVAFPGIAKAHAQALWNGRSLVVHITVSGANGSPIDPSTPLTANLLQAISAAADPAQAVQVASYHPRYFVISADVIVAPGNQSAVVLAAAQAALLAAFSFDARSFAQPVTAAEIAKTLQQVPGVLATVLRQLAHLEDPPVSGPPPAQLLARDSFYDTQAGIIQPAELLLLTPIGIILTETQA